MISDISFASDLTIWVGGGKRVKLQKLAKCKY